MSHPTHGPARPAWKPAPSQPRPARPARATPGWLHLLLFLLTVCTTTIAGVGLANRPAPLSLWVAARTVLREPARLLEGVAFSGPLLASLFAHEMGHYITARRWHVQAGWPFFVPLPMGLGTMGALIGMESTRQDRRALVEIGAAGPLVGFVAAFAFLLLGLAFSTIHTTDELQALQHLGALSMPDSPALGLGRWLVFGTLPPDRHVMLHPMALAGWYGLYLTWFNLLPFGQLDGGHMAFAWAPGRERWTSAAAFLLLPGLSALTGNLGWVAVAAGMALLGVLGGIDHPEPPVGPPLGTRQRWVVALSVLVFLLCFVDSPVPISRR